MPRLRIFYVISLVALGVLLMFTLLRPMVTGEEYSETLREHLLQAEDEWIIEFDIINHEGKEQNYTVSVWVDGKSFNQTVLIPDGKMFTYIHHVSKDQLNKGEVSFSIYREGENTPFKQATYHLK